MNTSAIINQTHTPTTRTARTTASGFRRRCMAGALLITTLTATAVGLASTAHADDAPAPNIQVAVPAPAALWLPIAFR